MYNGESIKNKFQYFTGYEIITDKFSGLERKIQKQYISKILCSSRFAVLEKYDTNFQEKDNLLLPLKEPNQSIENFESQYSIIDWTQERENYLERIKLMFETTNEKLNDFLKNLDNNKIDVLMQTDTLKYLS